MGRQRYDWPGRFRPALGHKQTVDIDRFGAATICRFKGAEVPMTSEFAIVETFEITGRGVGAVVNDLTGRDSGRALRVQLIKPSGEAVSTEAFKEWLLRRQPHPVEKEVFILKALHKNDIPDGSLIRFLD
jgi:hypothetical protein